MLSGWIHPQHNWRLSMGDAVRVPRYVNILENAQKKVQRAQLPTPDAPLLLLLQNKYFNPKPLPPRRMNEKRSVPWINMSYSPKILFPYLTLPEIPSSQGGMKYTARNCGDYLYALSWMNYHPVVTVLTPPW